MRILFLTQVLPYPLEAGPKVRAYHVLRRLAQSHEVTPLTSARSGGAPDKGDVERRWLNRPAVRSAHPMYPAQPPAGQNRIGS